MSRSPRLVAAFALSAAFVAPGCTLAKPLIGAITGPVVILGNTTGSFSGCGGCDGRAVVGVFGVMAVVGATAGLVTGIISDVQWMTGAADDPSRNWADPFLTNTSSER
ncbi:MAG: hypothetical protein JNN13_13430 [Planctomycetes bacterium]|nr:hypothetical protein [Planctomycetota bacterium]